MNSASTRCFVLGCPNSNENTTDATFHEFPEELQEEWLIAIGRDRDTFVIDELVCSDHFESTDFDEYDTIGVLKQNVIPTLNLPAEPEESFLTQPKLETSCTEEVDELINKYRSYDDSKVIKVIGYSVIKPATNKTQNDSEVLSEPSNFPSSSVQDEGTSEEYVIYEIPNCRTCLCEIEPETAHSMSDVYDEGKTLREMIVYCIPQMASTLLDTDLVCNNCLKSIKFCANFIENCLKVETEFLQHDDDNVSLNSTESSVDEVLIDENSTDRYRHVPLDHSYTPEIKLDCSPETSENVTTVKSEYVPVNNCSNATHECSKCDRSFRTENYLLDHVRKIHGNDGKKSKKRHQFGCDFCDKSFVTKLGYGLHLQLSHRDETDKKNPDFKTRKQKVCGFTCKICSTRFNTRAELIVHRNVHATTHLCEICGKGFKTKDNLKVHIGTHIDPNIHLCHECGQGFRSKLSLRLHLKRHDPDHKFRCDECPSVFQRKNRLEMHKKVRHQGIQEYMCAVCEKKFCYRHNLQSHYRLKHSDEKPYQCEKCGQKFPRSDYLRRHTNCGESKLNSFPRRRGRRIYRKGDSAPITCKLCDKVFKDVQMLRLHVKTHTKLRMYKCRTCNLTFTTSNNRNRHEKVHSNSSLLFRCEICFKRMETQEVLEEHVRMTHENSKKYKCHVCNELFGRKYLLHSHVAEKHGDVEDFEKEKEVLYKVVLQDYLVDD